MSHSLTKIWVHAVFSTKDREFSIQENFEKPLHDHLTHHLTDDFECCVRALNGTTDHLHILFLLSPNFALKDIMKNIKGESSHWVNQQNFTRMKFTWQTGYGAFSVSESNLNAVERYIQHQKEHHKKMTFAEEFELFMKKHGLQMNQQTDEQD